MQQTSVSKINDFVDQPSNDNQISCLPKTPEEAKDTNRKERFISEFYNSDNTTREKALRILIKTKHGRIFMSDRLLNAPNISSNIIDIMNKCKELCVDEYIREQITPVELPSDEIAQAYELEQMVKEAQENNNTI